MNKIVCMAVIGAFVCFCADSQQGNGGYQSVSVQGDALSVVAALERLYGPVDDDPAVQQIERNIRNAGSAAPASTTRAAGAVPSSGGKVPVTQKK